MDVTFCFVYSRFSYFGRPYYFLKYFLSGEITTRFISKVLALFGFSAMVFIYYFHVLTWDNVWSYHSRRNFLV